MNNIIYDSDFEIFKTEYENLKIENDRLLSQNVKLLKKLEEVTLQFSKSQTKIKDIEFKESSQTNLNGNLNKLLDQTKLLETDNKQLCKELKKQIELNKGNKETSVPQMIDKMSLKSDSGEKIINLKNHIRELQKQLLKTQQISFENECNYKKCQIETLEALKYCEKEKYSLGNKISNLEEAASNLLRLHQQNLDLKSSLSQCKDEVKLLKDQQVDLTKNLYASEQHKKNFQEEINALEFKLESSQIKVNNLTTENQCLLSTLEQLTSSVNKSTSERIKDQDCELCTKKSDLLLTVQNEMKRLEINLNEAEIVKDSLNIQNQEQIRIVNQFEENQLKLRSDLNNLTKSSSKYDCLLKSKDEELESVSCQLSSVEQLLELRDQRINEISNQLNKAFSEEKILTLKISQLSEMNKALEKDIQTYKQKLAQSVKENGSLSDEMEYYKALSENNNKVIQDHMSQLYQNEILLTEMKKCLETTKLTLDTKSQEFTSQIVALNKQIDDLNYNCKVHENETEKLEISLKVANEEIEELRNEGKQTIEANQVAMNEVHLEQQKYLEVINNYIADVKVKDLQIESISRTQNKLKINNCAKDEEIKSVMLQLDLSKKQLKECLEKITNISLENNQLKTNFNSIQPLKVEIEDKITVNKKLKQNLSEANINLDILKRNLSDEKEKNKDLNSKYKDMCSQIEALQLKFSYIEEELNRKRTYIKELEENQRSEVKYNFKKLRAVENERNDILSRMNILEGIKDKIEKECYLYKNKTEELQNVILIQKENLLSNKDSIEILENEICTLKNHIKCGQVALVESSRDVDRLEQMVRDRTEQIEIRSTKLQEFEIDLTEKLKELELQVSNYKSREEVNNIELDTLRRCNNDMKSKCDYQENKLKEISIQIEDMEKEKCIFMKQDQKLTSENQTLIRDLEILKGELFSKTTQVKDLLQQTRRNDKEIKEISEMLEIKVSDVMAKDLQIKKINEQLKISRKSFTEVEVKFKNELSLMTRKFELVESNSIKLNEKMKEVCKSECEKYEEELKLKSESIKRLGKDLDLISERLLESEEKFTNVKVDLETYKSVLIDTENNCRLKAIVIDRLLKKLNMESLKMYSEDVKDLKSSKEMTKNQECLIDIYEDVSLQELMNRITMNFDEMNFVNNF